MKLETFKILIIFALLSREKTWKQKAILCFYPKSRNLENFNQEGIKDIELVCGRYVFGLPDYI